MKPLLPADYPAFLEELKGSIRTAQVKTALAVNAGMLQLYWDIGRRIVEKQRQEGWGTKIIAHLAADLQNAFPALAGFSRANIYRMRAFHLAWSGQPPIVARSARRPGRKIVAQAVRQSPPQPLPQAVTQLPWGHNVILLEKLKNSATRLWYAQAAVEHGWTRDILALQIETGLYRRQGKAITNFDRALPAPQSDLAQQTLKDPYIFDFLTLGDAAREREMETQLIQHIVRFLVELGAGFAFVGRQVHMEVGGEDFYLDLLFYHTRLHCYVVIDLKVGAFKPEYAGKLNFYLSAVDDRLRQPDDKPTVGLLLCRTHNKLIAEYALRDVHKPVGIAAWRTRLTRALPKALSPSLPAVETIEQELAAVVRKKRKS